MKRDKRLKRFAREMRAEPNPTEKLLWGILRNRRFKSFKFRRQFPIGPYIADFACVDVKLIVEMDGETHVGRELYDRERRKYLELNGYRVLRIWNSQLHENSEGVMQHILLACEKGPPHPWIRD